MTEPAFKVVSEYGGHSVPYAGPTNHEAELAAGYGWRVVGWVLVAAQIALAAGVIGWLW